MNQYDFETLVLFELKKINDSLLKLGSMLEQNQQILEELAAEENAGHLGNAPKFQKSTNH